jgi:hypothetical protein
VSIKAVTPAAAASSPSHPEHARWVKEQTLKLEVGHHATFREAEIANLRSLERMANRKRKPKRAKKPAPTPSAEKLAASGVTVREAPKRKAPAMPPCKLCRQCVWCKRAIRVSMIGVKSRQQDLRARALQDELNAIVLAAAGRRDYRDALGRELPFSRIKGHDVDKAVTMGIEWVCDRSTTFMGQWR